MESYGIWSIVTWDLSIFVIIFFDQVLFYGISYFSFKLLFLEYTFDWVLLFIHSKQKLMEDPSFPILPGVSRSVPAIIKQMLHVDFSIIKEIIYFLNLSIYHSSFPLPFVPLKPVHEDLKWKAKYFICEIAFDLI